MHVRKRFLAVAAAMAAVLGMAGAAQAQSTGRSLSAAGPKLEETVVAGIPAAFQVTQASAVGCIWKVRGLPGPVTDKSGLTNNCTVLIDGVWPTSGSKTVTATVTTGGTTTTYTITVVVKASPGENDAAGVGSDTVQSMFDQFSQDYNGTVAATDTHLYSWDATNPITSEIGDSIPEKADCPAIPRPDGSWPGIAQLATFVKSTSGPLCTNFAMSARPRIPASDPPYAAGGVAFAALAGDAITWATQAATNAPKTLTIAQLNQIYACTVPAVGANPPNNWADLGGKPGTIAPFLPQPGSAVNSGFVAAIGLTPATLGTCVSNANNMLQENEGVNPALNSPNALVPYSIGKYIAESEHSAKCVNASCLANTKGVVCAHMPSKNMFGCDTHGTMVLKEINGIAPTKGAGTSAVINPAFPAVFDRTLFAVVPYDPGTADHIPGAPDPATGYVPVGGVDLESIFGASGWACTSEAADAAVKNYGFIPITTCGTTN